MSDETRITALEEQIAYLTKTVEELSDIVAQQEGILEKAERRLGDADGGRSPAPVGERWHCASGRPTPAALVESYFS